MQAYYSGYSDPSGNDVVAELRNELGGILQIFDVSLPGGRVIAFTGKLLYAPDVAFREVKARFNRYGYTPLLRRQGDQDIVVATPGIVPRFRSQPWVHLLLFLATIATTLLAGAMIAGFRPSAFSLSPDFLMRLVLEGAPFSFTLLLILGVHELGHYFLARLHGAQVTLPYFIPLPPLISLVGTLGAFIQLKSPIENRRALFDIGLAGPIAGFLVALPLLILGILLAHPVAYPGIAGGLGRSILVDGLIHLLKPNAVRLAAHPVYIAAWFGMLVTGLNLLPLGQLDGGHVAYAALGRLASPVALITWLGLLVAGVTVWGGWMIWAFLALFTGLRHPAPLDDITRLDWGRRALAIGALVLFLLVITPQPFV